MDDTPVAELSVGSSTREVEKAVGESGEDWRSGRKKSCKHVQIINKGMLCGRIKRLCGVGMGYGGGGE